MIQISTLINTNIDSFFSFKKNFFIDLRLKNLEETLIEEQIDTLDKACQDLPKLEESPSLACIDAILAYSKTTSKV